MPTPQPYSLGLPAWAFSGWQGPYFPTERPALESYASVFNAVEGNTTFYGIPARKTVSAWQRAVANRDFRFCFKLPRSVTHERKPDLADLNAFFTHLEPLGDNLGPFMIQLPARVGPEHCEDLDALLQRLPRAYRYVIEVRHPSFFREPELLEPLIETHGLGRVMLDSRPIYEGDRSHPDVLDALHEKPDVPVLDKVYANIAFVRLILHPDLDSNAPWLAEWIERTATNIENGVDTYMMIHCPNNQHCPELAERFHNGLRQRLSAVPPLSAWPVPQQESLI